MPAVCGLFNSGGPDYLVVTAAFLAAFALRLALWAVRLVFATALATGLSAAGVAAGAVAGAAIGAPVCEAACAVGITARGMAKTTALARMERNFFMIDSWFRLNDTFYGPSTTWLAKMRLTPQDLI